MTELQFKEIQHGWCILVNKVFFHLSPICLSLYLSLYLSLFCYIFRDNFRSIIIVIITVFILSLSIVLSLYLVISFIISLYISFYHYNFHCIIIFVISLSYLSCYQYIIVITCIISFFQPDLTAIRTYFTRWLIRTNSYRPHSYKFRRFLLNRKYCCTIELHNSYEIVRMTYT